MAFSIGILTFHNVPNYGASLQAFALKKYLENATDSSVNVLDFRCPGNSDEFLPKNYLKTTYTSDNIIKTLIKKFLVYTFYKKSYEKKHRKFTAFNRDMLGVAPYEDVYNKYHIIFCGSDQIWNPRITDGFKDPYFGLDKGKCSQTVISSFSASCGDITEFTREERNELFSRVKNLECVGVREKTLVEALQEAGIEAVNTVDPTFLLTKEEYTRYFSTVNEKKGYVLEYALRQNPALDEAAQRIAAQKGLAVKKVCGYIGITPENGIFSADPKDFIELVSGADYIVTNSFHGTAFSLIFNKDFNVVLPESRRGRVTDLLCSLGLEGRICEGAEDCDLSPVDYNEPNEIINKKINDSKRFIAFVLSQREGKNE